jgi:hypothetical protein
MWPYVCLIMEACEALGWADLAREVRRRYALYDMQGPSLAEMERLSYE